MTDRPAPRKGPDWHDLRPRVLSASVMIAVAGLAIVLGGPVYDLLILLAAAGMAAECAALCGLSVRSWRGVLYIAWAVCAVICACTGHWAAVPVFVATTWIFGGPAGLGLVAVIIGAVSLLWLRLATAPGPWSVLFVIAVVVMSDSSAYMAGRIFGGPKLAPRISPGKTRSGAAGGLVGAVFAGMLVAFLQGGGTLLHAAVWAGVLGVLAQAGDLAESAAKRAYGVKDSGTILPGHGGLLDRFDALLAAAPAAALLSLAAPSGAGFWSAGLSDLRDALFRLAGQ